MSKAIQNIAKNGSASAFQRSKRLVVSVLAIAAFNASSAACATEDRVEFWLNPSLRYWMDEKTNFRIETAQRFRNEEDGRPDTYFGRFWAGQRLNDNLSIEIGGEKRINDGDADETRLLQQVLTRHGIFRNRIRLELNRPGFAGDIVAQSLRGLGEWYQVRILFVLHFLRRPASDSAV